MGTFYLHSADASYSNGYYFDKLLKTTTQTSSTVTMTAPDKDTTFYSGFFYSESGIPHNADWEDGDIVVKVNVTTAPAKSAGLKIRAQRRNSSGVVQESTAYTAEQDLVSGTGVYTFTISNATWTAGADTDIFSLDFAYRNIDSHSSNSVTFETGTSDAEVTTGFTVEEPRTVTMASGGNGSVSDDTNTGPYYPSESINVSASPDVDYAFDHWEAIGDTTSTDYSSNLGNAYSTSTTFTVPNEHVTITGYFIYDSFSLTVDNSEYGGTGVDDTGTSPYSSTTVVDVSATTETNFSFNAWTATGDNSGSDYSANFGSTTTADTTFTMPAEDVTIKPTYTYTGTYVQATITGSVDSIPSGESVLERGFVLDYSTHSEPSVMPENSDYSLVISETGTYTTGSYNLTINNLFQDITYYVRSFATTDDTSTDSYDYSNTELDFTTTLDSGISGGSEITVSISEQGSYQKAISNSSEISININVESDGFKIAYNSSESVLNVSTEGSGELVIPSYSGSSETSTLISTEQAGIKKARAPPADASVAVNSEQDGTKLTSGSSESNVSISLDSQGYKILSSSSEVTLTISTESSGFKRGMQSSEISLNINSESSYNKSILIGSETSLQISPESSGFKSLSSSSESTLEVGVEGAGEKVLPSIEGSSESTLTIDIEGSGFKTSLNNSEGSVDLTTEGSYEKRAQNSSEVILTVNTESSGNMIVVLPTVVTHPTTDIILEGGE